MNVMYKIPLFDLNFGLEEEQAVLDTLRSKWISTGPKTTAFEADFAGMLGVSHALALANCTVSLHLAMKILGIGPGDEVICPSLTFVATVNAVRYVDAVPVFADICGDADLTMDPLDIERKITPRTRAIVVMHYAGFPCAMDEIMRLARRYNLKVIEDACHGPLSEYGGRKLGAIGDVGCFSFFSNKNISTGEGGMLVTNDEGLYEHAKLLRSHGMTTLSYERSKGHSTGYDVVESGYNYRMDDIRASIGIVQLRKLGDDLKKRAEVRLWYEDAFSAVDGVCVPFSGHRGFVSNYIFAVLLDVSCSRSRDEVRDALHKEGIQTSMHYPPVHLFSIFREFSGGLPVTESSAARLITLPMYSRMTKQDVGCIAQSMNEILHG
ncbi:MAG: DegT/DnrJ/EryC1/StrS family aminotransferase [Chlorobium limicola]|uniref:DegT/DnrJ/EryC1/StrS family aminotransferase n=1 Tax=Chlorobium limicola TaxID=1092 RepID=UPI0023F003D8|nr:DegT/DnrJ/EryC1/StrS family aminotransferase [Chlorobium limicola]NTV20923.1 DegT/DnrJ/EryC1/StrS family aminotransferase [Chlorobium limicola]